MIPNKDLFNIPGFQVHEAHHSESGNPVLVFRDTSKNWRTTLLTNPFKFDTAWWLPRINKMRSLLFNHIAFNEHGYENEEDLDSFIVQNSPNFTPSEKLENSLEYISSLMSFDGEKVDLNLEADIEQPEIWRKYYFNNSVEFMFYIETLREEGYIEYTPTSDTLVGLRLTVKGLSALVQIDESRNSRYCFVAMSFDKALTNIYTDGIQPAIIQTGYLPYIMTETHVDPERTINDEMITGLKKAHFTIAEFTQHRHNVYFEAGYALGRGQKVIYICSKADFGNAHFDTNHFQHIIWETTEDLKKQLIDKISAFITD